MKNFSNLIFEGGGVKGIAYGGALKELKRMGILPNVKRFGGTSSGAISATLLALGYSVDEILKILAETNFNEFSDDSFGFIRDIVRLVRHYGWHKGDRFESWIGEIIKKKKGTENLCLKDLKNLYVVGTNLSKQTTVIFSHETHPDMLVKKAVRISMSLPLYFHAVDKEDVFVDGALTMNYPLNIFDNKKYLSNARNGEKVSYNKTKGYVFNHETLGFRLDSKDENQYNKEGWKNTPSKITNIIKYLQSMVGFILESANKKHLHENDWNRTIYIDSLGVKVTDFDLSKKKIDALIRSGSEGVKKYFLWRKKNMKLPI